MQSNHTLTATVGIKRQSSSFGKCEHPELSGMCYYNVTIFPGVKAPKLTPRSDCAVLRETSEHPRLYRPQLAC